MRILSPVSRIARVALIAPVLVAASLSLACSAPGPPIFFESDRDGNLEIYSIDPSGEHESNFTNSGQNEFNPVVSPDRRSVAFLSGSENQNHIEVMTVSASERVPVTQGNFRHTDITWSPDNDRIAYTMYQDGLHQIMVVKKLSLIHISEPTRPY